MVEKTVVSNSTYWYEQLGRKQEFKPLNDLTVISIDINNNIKSYFYDDIWDLSPYSVSNKHQQNILNFIIVDKQIRKESKILMYMILMYGKSRFGRQLDAKTVKEQYFKQCIVPISNWIMNENINFDFFLSNEEANFKYVKYQIINNKKFFMLASFFKFLSNTYHESFTYKINIYKKTMNYLKEARKAKEASRKQTPIIPSRILSYALKARWEHIEYTSSHINNIANFIINYINTKVDSKNPEERFLKAVNKYKLIQFFERYKIRNRIDFSSFICKFQATCKNLIHMYSGMRREEANSLYIDSFEKNNNQYFLNGYTTKLEGRKKATTWVTSNKVELIFEILAKINNAMIQKHTKTITDKNIPLFLSVTTLRPTPIKSFIIPQIMINKELEIELNHVTIKQKDIDELQAIDPFRNWEEEEKFQLGSRWHFASHQYRRSLAVYAIGSGLVSIGALQIQLKHLFRDMTLYYSSGASRSKDIVNNYSKELINALKTTKPEIRTLEFISNVIFSDVELFGTYRKKLKVKNHNIETNVKTYILEDKGKTLKLFQNGDLAYKETALGGCISVNPCDSYLTNSLVACFACDCSILKKDRIQNTIKKDTKLLENFDSKSIEYRTIQNEIQQLEELKIKLKGE